MGTFTKKSFDNYMGKGRARTVVPLPDSGGTCVILSVIDGAALLSAEFRNAATKASGERAHDQFATFIMARSIVDEDGNRLYSDEEAHLLLKMPMPAWMVLWPKCAKINGLTEEVIKKEAKKSGTAKASASSTATRTTSEKPSASLPAK